VYGIDNSVTSLGRTVGPALSAACALWFSARATFLLTGFIFALACLLAAFTVCRSTPLHQFEEAESGRPATDLLPNHHSSQVFERRAERVRIHPRRLGQIPLASLPCFPLGFPAFPVFR
jgi:hypothetical protein